MTRPLQRPLNTSAVDHSTDAYDTIDWLVKNVPESNGKVGMLGSSYEGFTVVMALVNPHPALKVAAPHEPDGRRLDGRRLVPLRRVPPAELRLLRRPDDRARRRRRRSPRDGYDDYENFRRAGSAGDFAQGRRPRPAAVLAQDRRASRLRRVLAASRRSTRRWPRSRSTVPTMWIQGLWDQEDMWGAIHCYLAVEPKDTRQRHELSGDGAVAPQRRELRRLVARAAEVGTATRRSQFRRDVLKPFFDQYLKDGAPKADTPPVFIYNTGENHWDRLQSWPLACASGCAAKLEAAVSHRAASACRSRRRRARRDAGGVRRVRVRSRQAGAVPAAAGALRRRRRLAHVAGDRPALRRRIAPTC